MKLRDRKRRVYRSPGTYNLGRPCKIYHPGCIVCEGYRFFRERGRFAYTYEELSAYIRMLDATEEAA